MAPQTPADRLGRATTLEIPQYDDDGSSTHSTTPLQDSTDDGEQKYKSTQQRDNPPDRKSTRLNSSHIQKSRMPSSA